MISVCVEGNGVITHGQWMQRMLTRAGNVKDVEVRCVEQG